MGRPEPEPVDPSEARALALAIVQSRCFPFLASLDGDQPRLRPVSPVRTEGFTIYVANLRAYGKTAEIAANPRVELAYLDPGHDQVRITGVAEILKDQGILEEIWESNPLLQQYMGSLMNPDLIVYRIQPSEVRFMREWALEYVDISI
ncbi:MAG: pyridoxamine 5'-phosphate oxidase family protein [Verrucomicrobiota bacterium]